MGSLQDYLIRWMDSIGLLNLGHATGYLYCVAPYDAYRFWPCIAGCEKGSRKYDAYSRAEAFSFQELDDHWYAHEKRPS